MFGKVMSVSDDLMRRYFLLATQVSQDEIAQIFKITSNPRDIKVRLAREIVCLYHGQKKAQLAQENFEIKFGKGKGAIVPDFTLNKKSGSYPILDILVESKLAFSKSEARRKIKEGAVEVDGERIIEEMAQAKLKPGSLIRLGKRFAKIV